MKCGGWGIPCSELENFVNNPTLKQLDWCTKDDLVEVANHFTFLIIKKLKKEELKAQVIGKLAELNVVALLLVAPAQAEGALPEGRLRSAPRVAAVKAALEAVEVVAPTVAWEGGAWGKTAVTLPRFKPLSPGSSSGRDNAHTKVQIASLQLESQERASQDDYEFRLKVKNLETEADTAMTIKQVERDAQRHAQRSITSIPMSTPYTSPSLSDNHSDICKHVALVPPFQEAEVDSYFNTFERLAIALKWPEEMWPLLLQCKLQAQEVVLVPFRGQPGVRHCEGGNLECL